MRAILLVLLAFPVFGQVREGESSIRQQATALMLTVYLRADVTQACKDTPNDNVTVRVNGPGAEFTVSCPVRSEYLEIILEFYRRPEVIRACAETPEGRVTARVLGSDVPINCRERADYLRALQ